MRTLPARPPRSVLPGHNLLGLEIRDACVERAGKWAEALGLARRVRFARANATVSAEVMLPSYPGRLDLVTIQVGRELGWVCLCGRVIGCAGGGDRVPPAAPGCFLMDGHARALAGAWLNNSV